MNLIREKKSISNTYMTYMLKQFVLIRDIRVDLSKFI